MDKATGADVTAGDNRVQAADLSQGADLSGKVIGDFHLLRRIGQGGMGQVYLAEQMSLHRKVALKLLRSDLAANLTALRRFQAEAAAVARATHANIVQVYQIGEENGVHFMALEYVEGKNLREYLEKKGPPDPLIAISLLRQVAAALQRAGELGIIHRDIKPENILVTRKSEVKVADFGLSRIFAEDQPPLHLTQSGVTMGTPLYMSPEQVENRPLDPRTDIYSLGVTAYHLFAGRPPFRGQTPLEVAVQHVQKDPEPLAGIRPDLPPELCEIVHRMMAKKPEERYQTAHDIVRDLARLRDALVGLSRAQVPDDGTPTGLTAEVPAAAPSRSGGQLRPADARPAAPRARRRWRLWVGVPALALVLLVGFVFGRAARQKQVTREQQALLDAAPPERLPDPDRERERRLVQAFQEFASPNLNNSGEIQRGIFACTDLGLFYLKGGRLDDAYRFFKELDEPGQVPQYRFVGKLGQGMVWSLKDDPAASNDWFLKAFGKDRAPLKRLVAPKLIQFVNAEMWEMVAAALRRNHANAPDNFPAELEPYRHPPQPVVEPPPPKAGRPAAQKRTG